MREYHKIQTVFKRDPDTKFKTLLEGQYSLDEFEYLKNNLWLWTEKVDGTNIRVMWDKERITFGGKSDNAQIPAYLITRLQELFPLDKFKMLYPEIPMCLYGEGYGAKIQKGGGKYKSDGVDFVLFDVKIEEWWLQKENVEDIAQKLSIDIVPMWGMGTIEEAIRMTREGFQSKWGDFQAEGLVLRPNCELKTRKGNRIITKIKHKDFSNQPK